MNQFSQTLSSKRKISLLVNGNPITCVENISLAGLLNYLDFDFNQVIVEYNSEIIPRDKLHTKKLSNQDIIEVITIVGGG